MSTAGGGPWPSRLRRASIHRELLAFFVVGTVSGVLLLAYFQRQYDALHVLTEEINTAGRLRMLSQQTALLTGGCAREEAGACAGLEAARTDFAATLRQLEREPGASAALAPVRLEWTGLEALSRELGVPGRVVSDAESLALSSLASGTLLAAEANVHTLLPRVDAARDVLRSLLVLGVLLGVALVATMMAYIRARILRPLGALESLMDRFAAGDLSARVAVPREDELGRLMHYANRTAESTALARAHEQATLEQLRDSETRHRTLWETSTETIVTLDPQGVIRFVNPAVEATFGYRPEELVGQDIAVLQPEHLREAHRKGMQRYLASGKRTLNWRSVEIQALHRDGRRIPVELTFNEMRLTKDTWFVGTFRDITERKRHEEALEKSSNYDALTGLPNRSLLFDRLDQALFAARRYGRSFAVLLLDLDNFKVINDSLGHESGDELLREASRRLLTCVRDGDTVARLGGDEFVLLLSEVQHEEDLRLVAERALAAMSSIFTVSSGEGFVGASIGAALFPHDGTSRAELLQHADIAMYRAKESGRNGYQRYADHMQARARERLSMEAQLRRAVEAGELELHYQPQIDLGSGRVVGAEALVRWQSPSLGQVAPAQFIPLAEETGLIVPLGAWILDRACRDAVTWLTAPEGRECTVAVNLSARQFGDDGLMQKVAAAMAQHQLPPTRLELEITESLMMRSPDKAAGTLRELKRLGCHVALDDFGTGYSSLASLRTFPIDCLKIDRSLITDVAIVRAIIQLARSFGLRTLAEGVEDEAVLGVLKHLGCDVVQGYHYARPMPLAAFREFLLRAPPSAAPPSA